VGRNAAEQRRLIAQMWLHEKARVRVHSNACGDFTLLSRTDWERVGGYAELEMFSLHLDSLLLYEAHYTGIRHHVLPGAVYHLEHSMGFKPDTESLRSLTERIDSASIPQVSNDLFMEWVLEMYHRRAPMRMNEAGWGFPGETLAETDPYAPAPARLHSVAT
jgi:GT2 family glycosyltransferase